LVIWLLPIFGYYTQVASVLPILPVADVIVLYWETASLSLLTLINKVDKLGEALEEGKSAWENN